MSGCINPGHQGNTSGVRLQLMTALTGVNWNQTIYCHGSDKIYTFLHRKSILSTMMLRPCLHRRMQNEKILMTVIIFEVQGRFHLFLKVQRIFIEFQNFFIAYLRVCGHLRLSAQCELQTSWGAVLEPSPRAWGRGWTLDMTVVMVVKSRNLV